MGNNVWYRGEAVGVVHEGVGSTSPYNLGDGMYVTDNVESAINYSKLRSSDPAARRVFSVEIDLSKMRVLDLTTDPRWQKDLHLLEPTFAVSENYGAAFQNFIRTNKIDLSQYDVIIGKDYQYGGKQLCIPYKSGSPAPMQMTVRQGFRPIRTLDGPGDSGAPHGPVTIGGKIGRGLKGMRGTFVAAAGSAALAILAAWLFDVFDSWHVKKELSKMPEQVNNQLQEHLAAVAAIQAKGKQAYANVTFMLRQGNVHGGFDVDGPTPTIVELLKVSVSSENIKTEKTEEKRSAWASSNETTVTYSFDVSLSTEEVNLFKALMKEYTFVTSSETLSVAQVKELELAVRKKLILAFGPMVELDVLDDYWWSKMGLP